MRTQIINDLMTNIFFNLIETEDRIAADERFEGLSSNDALEIYKVLSDQLIRTHIYAAHIGSGISSRIAMSIVIKLLICFGLVELCLLCLGMTEWLVCISIGMMLTAFLQGLCIVKNLKTKLCCMD